MINPVNELMNYGIFDILQRGQTFILDNQD